jgi:AraC-like DNA-binding protein
VPQLTYRERETKVSGAVLWRQVVAAGRERIPIMPDGCMDLLWDGHRLFVAGPDTHARWHQSAAGTEFVALRFAFGTGPAVLGVPADELADQTPDLTELRGAAEVRELTERVAADPAAALESWAAERAAAGELDPLGRGVFTMAAAGMPVAVMARRTGLSVRQLHRRCLPLFGYGPRHLMGVLRMGRAVEAARAGAGLAESAAGCGYADQAHLSREVRALTGMTPTGLLGELGERAGQAVAS